MNDAIAGHVDLLIGSTALAIPQIQAGTIRGVVQTGKARTSALGTIPTVNESGFPDFEAYAWWGVFAPAGTPGEMIARFGAELTASLREPRIATQLTEGQQVTMALSGPQELRSFLFGQMKTWGAVAREFDIKGE
jgi:tripartite-type tricarboxylate transporter receptor subunit TctC